MLINLGNLLYIGLNIKDGLNIALEEFITANTRLKKFDKDKVRINMTDDDSIIISWQKEKTSPIIDNVAIFIYDTASNQFIAHLTSKYISSNILLISTVNSLNLHLKDSITFLNNLNSKMKTSTGKVEMGFHSANDIGVKNN